MCRLGVVAILSILFLASCIQESADERIPVRYTVLVRNGETGAAMEGASVELTGEALVTQTLTTNKNGRVVFPSLESYVNQVIVSAKGFIPTDTVDVITVSDSTAQTILRTLNLSILPEGSDVTDSGTVYSYVITVLDATNSQPVAGATVSAVSGTSKSSSTTTNARGLAYLDSLPSRQNLFAISASGYITTDTLDVAPADSLDETVVLRSLRVLLDDAPVSQ